MNYLYFTEKFWGKKKLYQKNMCDTIIGTAENYWEHNVTKSRLGYKCWGGWKGMCNTTI